MTACVGRLKTASKFALPASMPTRDADATVFRNEWSVLVVDGSELVQAGMRALLLPLPWVGTVVTATSFDIALLTARSHKPRIAVLDILTLGAQGLAACRLLHEATPWTRIALMAAEGAMPRPLATKYGVSGFLSKSTRAETLCQQIYRVGNGEQAFQCNGSQPSMNKLTERERNVLENLSRGCTNRELAQKMQLSENTVKQHVSAVYRKLEVRNRAEATSRALELGLVY